MAVTTLWWPRSFADGDTHVGIWMPRGGSVRSACGLEFVPLPVGIPARRQPLPGAPPDRNQMCLRCAGLVA